MPPTLSAGSQTSSSRRPAPARTIGTDYAVRTHIAPHIGRYALAKLTPQHIASLLATLGEARKADGTPRYKATTIRRTREVLRNALNQAVKWNLIPRNVVLLVDGPKAEKYDARFIERAEAERLLQAAQADPKLDALVTVALLLGLRKGEALGLRWVDVDWTLRRLTIRRALVESDNRLQLADTKTAGSVRTVPLPQQAIRALERHRARQAEARLLAGGRWQDQGLVFPSSIGTPWNPHNVLRLFGPLIEQAGLGELRFHDLRHTYASLQLAAGTPVATVSKLLGHTSITTTVNLYGHLLEESKGAAADVMDRLFSGTDGSL